MNSLLKNWNEVERDSHVNGSAEHISHESVAKTLKSFVGRQSIASMHGHKIAAMLVLRNNAECVRHQSTCGSLGYAGTYFSIVDLAPCGQIHFDSVHVSPIAVRQNGEVY